MMANCAFKKKWIAVDSSYTRDGKQQIGGNMLSRVRRRYMFVILQDFVILN